MHIRTPQPHELPTRRQLACASAAALIVSAALIVCVILPAERGIDPTGIGERLQLTRIGLLKAAMSEPEAAHEDRPQARDEVTITIEPGQSKEIKMDMKKGFEVAYSWRASAALSHDTHGDIYGNEDVFISYSSARNSTGDSGTIVAPFGGGHGWYWKNRSDDPISVTVKAEGQYLTIGVK